MARTEWMAAVAKLLHGWCLWPAELPAARSVVPCALAHQAATVHSSLCRRKRCQLLLLLLRSVAPSQPQRCHGHAHADPALCWRHGATWVIGAPGQPLRPQHCCRAGHCGQSPASRASQHCLQSLNLYAVHQLCHFQWHEHCGHGLVLLCRCLWLHQRAWWRSTGARWDGQHGRRHCRWRLAASGLDRNARLPTDGAAWP